MTFIEDWNSDERSAMNRASCPCTGAANGVRCEHYWHVIQRFPSSNAEYVRDGKKNRGCMRVDGFFLEFDEIEMPTRCNQYQPMRGPGLVALVARAVALATFQPLRWGYVPYDPVFEKFDPVTPQEVEELRKMFPDRPEWMRRETKTPDQWTVSDIVNGPQIGIVKPGDPVPATVSGQMQPDAERALDEMFGSSAPPHDIFNPDYDE